MATRQQIYRIRVLAGNSPFLANSSTRQNGPFGEWVGLAKFVYIQQPDLLRLAKFVYIHQPGLLGLARLAKAKFCKYYANLASLANLASVGLIILFI
jgi:hypothetical protein